MDVFTSVSDSDDDHLIALPPLPVVLELVGAPSPPAVPQLPPAFPAPPVVAAAVREDAGTSDSEMLI